MLYSIDSRIFVATTERKDSSSLILIAYHVSACFLIIAVEQLESRAWSCHLSIRSASPRTLTK